MSTTITIVVDNKAPDGLSHEHGLCMWIETEGKRILFDTGYEAALEDNAQALGIDLSSTDTLVLSHGHYDHTGRVADVLHRAPQTEVYFHPGIFRSRFALEKNQARSIGIPQSAREALENLPPERLHWVEKPVMLTPSVGLTGPIPRLTTYEDTGGSFFFDVEGTSPDPIEDDLALWISTDQGTVVCLGCAHAGAVNTLMYIRKLTGDERVRAVIGGFHLLNASCERTDQTIVSLRELAPHLIVPCHCTGDSAIAVLQEALGEQVSPGHAGMIFSY
jgi:7,8-dihydropterin-6-yl-methyl-4-(beta-D-ribofuranosyl)aminobenzene 5'-phosphate synthase